MSLVKDWVENIKFWLKPETSISSIHEKNKFSQPTLPSQSFNDNKGDQLTNRVLLVMRYGSSNKKPLDEENIKRMEESAQIKHDKKPGPKA